MAGSNCLVLEETGRHVTVQAYDPDLPERQVPIVNAVTVYDCSKTGRAILCLLNEALHMPDLQFTLICPNQIRDNGGIIDERPRQFCPDSIFGIYLPEDDAHIPFDLEGVIAGFDSRLPTIDELYLVDEFVSLTSSARWDPQHPDLAIAEERMGPANAEDLSGQLPNQRRLASHDKMKSRRLAIVTGRQETTRRIKLIVQRSRDLQQLHDIERFETVFRNLWLNLEDTEEQELDQVETSHVRAVRVGEANQMVNAENLSKMWMIGRDAAERTLHSTTQHGIRRLTTPAARRFRTQMKHLRYPTLPGIWYGDTM